jgi:hypothetical protein
MPSNAVDDFYLKQNEPVKSCMLAMRDIILSQDKHVSNVLKYGMPFFCYNDKMFCYLWVHKKYKQPYLGMVEGNRLNHPDLIVEKRARMKILLVDATKDLPIKKIKTILHMAVDLYKSGEIKT